VEYVTETVSGDTAVVRICVGGRLPLEEVQLVRRDQRWMITTDPPIPGLADELRKLAYALNRVAGDIEHRALTPEQLKDELALRQEPILSRIRDLIEAAKPEREPTGRP
jgi:hypothetical protein